MDNLLQKWSHGKDTRKENNIIKMGLRET